MKRTGIDLFINAWVTDPGFRRDFGANPDGALAARGISLEPHELDALTSMGVGERLDSRISPDDPVVYPGGYC